jgi:uncharacterized delta-60 repeat protein
MERQVMRDRVHNKGLPFVFALALISMACNNPLQKAIDDKLITVSPTIAPGGGKFLDYKDITIECDAVGAEIRYTTDGSDPTSSGTASEYASSFRLNYDCTLTVAAKSGKLGWSPLVKADFAFAYSSDSLDPTFGPHTGYCQLAGTTSFYLSDLDSVALQSDGKIIVAGAGCIETSEVDYPEMYPCLARLTSSGELDTTFGNGGYVLVRDATYRYGKAQSIAIDSQDRIYFMGYRSSDKETSTDIQGFIGRLAADGSLDTGYGTGGVFYTPADSSGSYSLDANHLLALDPSSYVAYFAFGQSVYRLTSEGKADTTFSADGKAELDTLSASFGFPSAIGLQSGLLVIAGADTGAPALMRLLASGGLDTSFGSSGISVVGIDANTVTSVTGCDMVIVPDGVVALNRGAMKTSPLTDFSYYFAKFGPNGGLNSLWGKAVGVGTCCDYDTGKCYPSAIAVLKDGSLVAGGSTTTAASSYWTTVRLNSSGLPNFNRPDITGLGRGRVMDLTVQPDGKYIAVGYAKGKSIVARYWP